ncbi:MAG: GH92 family glycosyl hydrolase [Verrucomicrobiales bacterium]|nr:GH92 family glycosyl hydrolase [Verrucomicrobiales bacterium]
MQLKVFPVLLLTVSVALARKPVDYVNPYIGNISHLLVPTYPTVQRPNSMVRFYPARRDFTDTLLHGFPLTVTKHRRGGSVFLLPLTSREMPAKPAYHYDQEQLTPYNYFVRLDEPEVTVAFAPSRQAGLYQFDFDADGEHRLALSARAGAFNANGGAVSGSEDIGKGVKLFFYVEFDPKPAQVQKSRHATTLTFPSSAARVSARYGISYISAPQAEKNLRREIDHYDLNTITADGHREWNAALGKIQVTGSDENNKTIFYTALYRTYERMVNVSEDGRYFSPFDNQVHDDNGAPFYTDDWVWDTYLAAHPLGILLNPDAEQHKLASYIRMYEQSGRMPTFPGPFGDDHAMNGNHYIALFLDAWRKGLRNFDFAKAYEGSRRTVTETTLIPWKKAPATKLDKFYADHGYFPALRPDEAETCAAVTGERRQAVTVTLAAAYDDWCLSQMARELGQADDEQFFARRALNYRHVFNPATGFFHPKDADGEFIKPFDYVWSGGNGARDYYDENHGWIYRWDARHNIADLMQLMGGTENFCAALDATFDTAAAGGKHKLHTQLPDHTGNVGHFSMGNEPGFHIPYLYTYAGQPWKTQRRVRSLLTQWFRNDLMGIPGDEDGGGMSAFVVFSMMGFYPVTPGLPVYVIGSPSFERVTISLSNGKHFTVSAKNYARENIYIQAARLNGKELTQPWFHHRDLADGGELELTMGDRPNKSWGVTAPPSWEAP